MLFLFQEEASDKAEAEEYKDAQKAIEEAEKVLE